MGALGVGNPADRTLTCGAANVGVPSRSRILQLPVLLALFVFGSALGQGEPPDRSAADRAREAGQLLPAMELYRRILQADPSWTEGWWYQGAIEYELDRYAEAVRSFEKVLAARPGDPEALALLGLAAFESGDFGRAETALAQAVGAGMGAAEGLGDAVNLRHGMLLARRGEFEVAVSVLGGLALKGRHDRPLLREALGVAALRLYRLPREVPTELREPVLLAGRATALVFANLPDDAGPVFRELVRRFPQVANTHFIYGNYLIKSDPEAALEQYRLELAKDPQHLPSWMETAFEQLRQGRLEEALSAAETAQRLAPNLFATRLVLGRVLLAMNRMEPALSELERAVSLAPDSPETHFSLAQALRALGREAEARKSLEEFQRLKSLVDAKPSPGVRN